MFPFEAQSDTDDESEEPSQTSTVHLAERQHKSDVCDEGKEHERKIFKRTTAVPLLCHKHKLQPEPQGQSKSGGFFLPSLIIHIFGWNRSTIYLYLIYLSVITITFFSTFALLFISNFCFVCLFVCFCTAVSKPPPVKQRKVYSAAYTPPSLPGSSDEGNQDDRGTVYMTPLRKCGFKNSAKTLTFRDVNISVRLTEL